MFLINKKSDKCDLSALYPFSQCVSVNCYAIVKIVYPGSEPNQNSSEAKATHNIIYLFHTKPRREHVSSSTTTPPEVRRFVFIFWGGVYLPLTGVRADAESERKCSVPEMEAE